MSRLDLLEALEVVAADRPEIVEPLVLRDVQELDYAEIAALRRADVVFELDRATTDLTHAREELLRRYAECETSAEVVAAQSAFLQEAEEDRRLGVPLSLCQKKK